MSKQVAAIDCGTNAIRLLISHVDSQGNVRDLSRQMRTVRLGEGVDRTGEFSQAALERTFSACREYAQIISEFEVEAVRFIATSASRDVTNRMAFESGVVSILGIQPEVISGEEEAELSYIGAISGFTPSPVQPILVADIGGGSTEFVMHDSHSGYLAHSVNLGCVRMTERYLHSDPPTPDEIQKSIDDIHRDVNKVRNQLPVDNVQTFIGLAGSVTTIAAMSLGLGTYDPAVIHGTVLTFAQVESVTQELLRMTRVQRASLGFMHPGRVDVIGGGALVLQESMRELELTHVLVSEHDLLDGVVSRLIA